MGIHLRIYEDSPNSTESQGTNRTPDFDPNSGVPHYAEDCGRPRQDGGFRLPAGAKWFVLLYLAGPEKSAVETDDLPRRVRWLAAFSKVNTDDRAWTQKSGEAGTTSVAMVKLTLTADAVSHWVPESGASRSDFERGSYQILKGKYEMHLTDSNETATLDVL